MGTYTCNHCGKEIVNHGGPASEVGMFWVDDKCYHEGCIAKAVMILMQNEGWLEYE